MFENMELKDFVRMKIVIMIFAVAIIIIYINYVSAAAHIHQIVLREIKMGNVARSLRNKLQLCHNVSTFLI